ncbi:hypothetical protein LUZ60_003362 [Juncus effusus]|nr:hypothetical protein LUZ60_003362 [Juncus effusus]
MLRYLPTILRFKSCPSSIFSPYQLQRRNYSSLIKSNKTSQLKTMASMVTLMKHQLRLRISTKTRTINLRLNNLSKSRINWNLNQNPSRKIAGLLCLSLSISSGPAFAEMPHDKNKNENIELNDENNSPVVKTSHGKEVHTDYSIIGIPGDGRCMFRSLVHGACIRSGRPSPKEPLQKQLADDLREQVADEFVKRREECEWFVEGDFDLYVANIRKPHVWGGEPELFMASHVLQMPITVYMHDDEAGGLISIAEYGQEYGKENPIRVLYHGFGHYDALSIPGIKGPKSRL